MCEQERGIISGIIATFVSLTYWFIATTCCPNSSIGVYSLGNIKCYILLIAFWLIVFLACYSTSKFVFQKDISIGKSVSRYIVCFACIGALISIAPFIKDASSFPIPIVYLVVILIAIMFANSIKHEKSNDNLNALVLIVIGGILWGFAVATPNTFSPASISATYDVHHTSAYIDSIYNVYKHIGFHGGITEQYGHYALFYYLPLKVFGFSTKTIAVVIGILSALCFVLIMISFCRIVKSNIVRYAIIVIGCIYAINPALESIYWQSYPHRLIFPAIMLFLSTTLKNKRSAQNNILLVLILSMAVIWNFESGIVCCLAWAAFSGMYILQKHDICLRTFTKVLFMLCEILVLPIFIAYCVVNIYNLSVGDMLLSINEFIGMAMDNTYINSLSTAVEWGNKTYLHKILVFMLCFCWGILHNNLFGIKENEEKAKYVVLVSTIGLGLHTYYLNRTLAGDSLVNIFFVLCLGIIISSLTTDKIVLNSKSIKLYNEIKIIVVIYAFMVLLGCGIQSVNFYDGYEKKYNANAYSYDDFKRFTEEIANNIPQNTWAMGDGMSAIYMELGWDKGTWGFGDVQADEIPNQNSIFVSNIRYDVIPNNFELQQQFIYYDIAFGYFVRKE